VAAIAPPLVVVVPAGRTVVASQPSCRRSAEARKQEEGIAMRGGPGERLCTMQRQTTAPGGGHGPQQQQARHRPKLD